jgi:RHS repeat-associated protein
VEHRNPDRSGNLFERLDRKDRKYKRGGQLLKTENWEYKYDKEGNLIRKKDKHGAKWRYEWNDAGMLAKVKRPDAREIFFKYNALGRRIEKQFGNVFTRWVWDGNTPLHEQAAYYTPDWDEVNKVVYDRETKYPLITWVFEEGTFVPAAKITEKQKLSIATNYLGSPEAMYREDGEAVWTCELNSYGKVRDFKGLSKTECPFRYQGQYEDAETGLYYNRFRYYSPEEGMYLSQDPIGLAGGDKLYAYVPDVNAWLDPFGLSKQSCSQQKGINKAKHDLERNGFTVVSEEVTMKVNGARVRADIVAVDSHGKIHVFEVKHGNGKLTKHQTKSGVYNMGSQSNTTTHLGGGTIQTSKGTSGTFKVDTDGTPGRDLGGGERLRMMLHSMY